MFFLSINDTYVYLSELEQNKALGVHRSIHLYVKGIIDRVSLE